MGIKTIVRRKNRVQLTERERAVLTVLPLPSAQAISIMTGYPVSQVKRTLVSLQNHGLAGKQWSRI